MQKKRLAEQKAMRSPGFWIFFAVIVVIFIFLFKSCTSSDNTTETTTTETTNVAAVATSSDLEQYYVVEKSDNDESNIRLSIYVTDVAKIDSINQYLISGYNSDKSKYMQVYYFNNEKIANTYMDKEADNNVSEKEKNRLFKHLIAVYRFNPSTEYENLNYEHN